MRTHQNEQTLRKTIRFSSPKSQTMIESIIADEAEATGRTISYVFESHLLYSPLLPVHKHFRFVIENMQTIPKFTALNVVSNLFSNFTDIMRNDGHDIMTDADFRYAVIQYTIDLLYQTSNRVDTGHMRMVHFQSNFEDVISILENQIHQGYEEKDPMVDAVSLFKAYDLRYDPVTNYFTAFLEYWDRLHQSRIPFKCALDLVEMIPDKDKLDYAENRFQMIQFLKQQEELYNKRKNTKIQIKEEMP